MLLVPFAMPAAGFIPVQGQQPAVIASHMPSGMVATANANANTHTAPMTGPSMHQPPVPVNGIGAGGAAMLLQAPSATNKGIAKVNHYNMFSCSLFLYSWHIICMRSSE